MQPDDSFPGTLGYAASERELLRAVRDLVRADSAMRVAMARRMTLGPSDLRALRFVMAGERTGRPTSPRDLAAHLDISTAATTTLLDRLVEAGHVERVAHPTDGRSKVVVATPHAYERAQHELAAAHDRMRAAAATVPEAARPAVLAFLAELTDIMRSEARG